MPHLHTKPLQEYVSYCGQPKDLTHLCRHMYAMERLNEERDRKIEEERDKHIGEMNVQGLTKAVQNIDFNELKDKTVNISQETFSGLVDSMIAADVLGQPEDVSLEAWVNNGPEMIRFNKFVSRAAIALDGFQPALVPEQLWEFIKLELFYRVQNRAWPLGADDVVRFYRWATVTITNVVSKRLDETGHEFLRMFVDDFQEFALQWSRTIETVVRGTKPMIQRLVKALCKQIIRILIPLIKSVVFLVIGVIIRILKLIPYTCWLGAILGYVFVVVQYVVEIVLAPVV